MYNDPVPQGNYRPASRHGDLVFTAGMTPRKDGVLLQSGRVPADADPVQYSAAVRLAAQNALTAAVNCLEKSEELSSILALTVYVNAEPGFALHSRLADAASDYLAEVLGSAGIGARTAVGVSSLPGGAPVEISLIAAVRPA